MKLFYPNNNVFFYIKSLKQGLLFRTANVAISFETVRDQVLRKRPVVSLVAAKTDFFGVNLGALTSRALSHVTV